MIRYQCIFEEFEKLGMNHWYIMPDGESEAAVALWFSHYEYRRFFDRSQDVTGAFAINPVSVEVFGVTVFNIVMTHVFIVG